jgi:hypothetical protein
MKNQIVLVTQETGALSRYEETDLPEIVRNAGKCACFVWWEFFMGEIRNTNTRIAYERNVRRFLGWCEKRSIDIRQITPGMVGQYFAQHPGGPSTKKQHLAAIKKFFDLLVVRHVVALNPAASMRCERYQVIEGKTPEIPVDQVRELLASIDTSHVIGLRDRGPDRDSDLYRGQSRGRREAASRKFCARWNSVDAPI